MDNDELINNLKKAINQKPFANELDGYKIFLFGSRTSGSNKERSDIDIGILGNKKLPTKIFFELENIKIIYE